MYPKSGDPSVTLVEEKMLYPEPCTDHGFMDWGMMCHVVDENGKDYYMDAGLAKMKMNATWGAMPFGTEDMDSWNLSCRTGEDRVYTPKGQIFKLADFNDVTGSVFHPFPGGSMQFDIDEEKNFMTVTLDVFKLEIDVNKHTWHATVYDPTLDVGIDFTHYGEGYPLWYSKDYVRSFVDHLQSIGYNWPGRLEGTLTVGGETHQVHGFCSRERTILPDQSNVEAGGWLDLIMVNFDELHTACTEYKLSRDKACELYLRKEDKYYATKDPKAPVDEMLNFEITHEDWAFIKAIGCFVPTTYIVKVEVEEGTLEYTAKVCGCKCVAQQAGAEADVPNVTLDAKEVTGTFTYKDGTVLELHNGFFINNVVCWRAYPSWIPNFGAAQDYVEVNPMKG